MKKINWQRKLTSRKFWVAVAGLVTSTMILFGTDAEVQVQVSAVILALGTVVGYTLGEGLADSKHEEKEDGE